VRFVGVSCAYDVRFGTKADIAVRLRNVRFTPKSGHPIGIQRIDLNISDAAQQHDHKIANSLLKPTCV